MQTITVDTVLTSDWDLHGDILHLSSKISGNITIRNAIIEANPYIQIFSPEVLLINCKTKEFSTAWYGANKAISDNSTLLQRCIDICIFNGITNLYVADSYQYSTSLKAYYLYNGIYTGFCLNMYGDSDMWNNRTTLTYTGNSFAIGYQLAKGGSISKLWIHGKYVPPINTGISYYNTNFPVSVGLNGIVIDYDGTKNSSGTSALHIHDTMVDGFDVLYSVSPNGFTFNADVLTFTNIRCGNGRIGFQSGQAQEKGNQINNIVSWGNLQTLISIGKSGKYQAGQYIIRNGNIAGGCVQLFDISLSGWNGFAVHGLYAESIARIGTIYAWTTATLVPVDIRNLYVRFALKAQAGNQTLITSNSPRVKLSDSSLWYYGTINELMTFSGRMTFDNCDFGRSYWNNNSVLNLNYKTGTQTSLHTQ